MTSLSRLSGNAGPNEDMTARVYIAFHLLALAIGGVFAVWSLAVPDYFHFAIGSYFTLGLIVSLNLVRYFGEATSRSFSLCFVPTGVMLLQTLGVLLELSTYDFRIFSLGFALASVALAGFLGRSKAVFFWVTGVAAVSVIGTHIYYSAAGEHDIIEVFLMAGLLGFAAVVSFEFMKTRDQLVRARAEAEHALALKNRFISNLSHEIRTPLAGIVGLTQILPLTSTKSELQDLINRLHTTTETLRSQVEELLDFQQLERTSGQEDVVRVNIRSFVERRSAGVRNEVENRGVHFTVYVGEEVPKHLWIDRELFTTCIDSLLSNAGKFTPEGKIEVVVGTGHTHYNEAMNSAKHSLVLTVADTGIGMSPEFVERATEPFVQGDDSYAKQFGGTGLGLARVRLAVRRLKGSMKIESTPGEGTSVCVTVPADNAQGRDVANDE